MGVLILILLLILYLAIWACAMDIICKAAREKGYDDLTGRLWFIGLFSSGIAAGVVVAALPDKTVQQNTSFTDSEEAAEAELPSI